MLDKETVKSLTSIPPVGRARAEYQSGFDPVSSSASDMGAWSPMPRSADLDVIPAKEQVEGRAIDVEQNDGRIAGAMAMKVDNLVGTGLRLNAMVDGEHIGLNAEATKELNRQIEKHWRRMTAPDSTMFDVAGMHNWSSLQAQAARMFLQHGEILAAREGQRTSAQRPFVTCMRFVDPSRLSDPETGPDVRKRNIKGGVEFNEAGAPVAGHISSHHRRDYFGRNMHIKNLKWTRVPIYDKRGRRRLFHVIDPQRVEQTRGMSLLAPILKAVKMIGRVNDAVLRQALMQSVFAAVVKSNANWEQVMEVIGASGESDGVEAIQDFMQTRAEYYNVNQIKIDGARAVHLLPDETLELATAKAANPDVGEFLDNFRGEIARGFAMSVEQYSGDYSKTSYSSSRMTGHIFNANNEGISTRVLAPFCLWFYGLWLEELFIRLPELLPRNVSWAEHSLALKRAEFRPRPPVDPDPERGAKAAQARLDAGISTLEYECRQLGLDWEEVLEQRAREGAMMQSLGIVEQITKMAEAKNGGPKPEPAAKPAPGGSK